MVKIELEYIMKTSPTLLYNRLSTASGLAEWFADDVLVKDNVFSFIWDGEEEKAVITSKKKQSHVKFKWLDNENTEYFEFKILFNEISNELTLIVTDFVDEDEKEDAEILWDTQIGNLKTILGS